MDRKGHRMLRKRGSPRGEPGNGGEEGGCRWSGGVPALLARTRPGTSARQRSYCSSAPRRQWQPGRAGGVPAAPYLVLRGDDVPGAGHPRWVVSLRPVGRLEGPRRLLQSSPAVLIPCKHSAPR